MTWFSRRSRSTELEMSDLEDVLAQFLQSFSAYASEVVLLAGLESKNIEVLLEAFAEAILDFEQQIEMKDVGHTPMTTIAEFAATGLPAGIDNRIPSCEEVIQYMMWFAILTSTEHKVVQRGKSQHPKRSLEDITRTANDYGLKVDIVRNIYRIIRENPIKATAA